MGEKNEKYKMNQFFTEEYLKYKFDGALIRIEDVNGKLFYSQTNELISKENTKETEWRLNIVQILNKVDQSHNFVDFIVNFTHKEGNFNPISQIEGINVDNLYKIRISAEKSKIRYSDEGWTSFSVLFIQPIEKNDGEMKNEKFISIVNEKLEISNEIPSSFSFSFSVHRFLFIFVLHFIIYLIIYYYFYLIIYFILFNLLLIFIVNITIVININI